MKMKRLLSALLVLCMALALLPAAALAEGAEYTVTLSVTPEGSGRVTGAGTYSAGETVMVYATAYSGYRFDHWERADGSFFVETASHSFIIQNNLSLVAVFVEDPTNVTGYTLKMPASVTATPNEEFTAATAKLTKLSMATDLNGITPVKLRVILSSGTLVNEEDNSKTIAVYPSSTRNSTYPVTAQSWLDFTSAENRTFYVRIENSSWTSAAPGTYTGTMSYIVRWYYDDNKWSGDIETGTISLSATIPNTAAEHVVELDGDGDVEGGSITASANGTARAGETVTLTATPDNDYVFGEWKVTGENGDPVAVTGNTFIMPDSDVTVSAVFLESVESFSYLDEDGETQTAGAACVSEKTTVLTADVNGGWYAAWANLDLDTRLTVKGDVNLILALPLSARGIDIEPGGSLTIWGGAGDEARTLTIDGVDAGKAGIDVTSAALTINGGVIDVEGGIGGEDGAVTLSWSRQTQDRIKADSYGCAVTLRKVFADDDNNRYYGAITDNSALAGKTLNPAAMPEFKTQSLTLGEELGVNFYMDIPEEYRAGSYMTFDVSGRGGTTTARADYDPAKTNRSATYYGFTCRISSIQMADTITATYHYFEGETELTIEKAYSIATYVTAALEDSLSDKEEALIKAVADYGHFAQAFLSAKNGWTLGSGDDQYGEMTTYYKTGGWSAAEQETIKGAVAAYEIDRSSLASDVSRVTFSLTLDSATAINLFVKPAEGYTGGLTASEKDGAEVTTALQSDGRYKITIKGISAHELGVTYEVTIKTAGGTSAVKVSAMSYVYAVLESASSNSAERNCAAALYEYWAKTMAYLG